MDEIFERNVLKQDSLLCKISCPTLLKISKFLPPSSIVNLSHTCKQLYQSLPFYLIKSGREIKLSASGKVCSSVIWFDGPAINFTPSEINIFVESKYDFGDSGRIWMEIVRSGKVVLETEKYFCGKAIVGLGECNIRFTKKHAALAEYKRGDKLRFWLSFLGSCWIVRRFEVSLQLNKFEYGDTLYVSERVKGIAQFKNPYVFLECPRVDASISRPRKPGKTSFCFIKLLGFILDNTASF